MATKKEYTQEQKDALRKAKPMVESLIDDHGQETAVWAIKRILSNLRSLKRLKQKEQRLNEDLKEVRAKMNFEK